jgi:hypothetical protein
MFAMFHFLGLQRLFLLARELKNFCLVSISEGDTPQASRFNPNSQIHAEASTKVGNVSSALRFQVSSRVRE